MERELIVRNSKGIFREFGTRTLRTHCRLVLLHLMEEHWIFVNNTNIGYFYIKVFTILWRLAYNRGRRKQRYVEGGGGGR